MSKVSRLAKTGETFALGGDIKNALFCYDQAVHSFSSTGASEAMKAWVHANRADLYRQVALNRAKVVPDEYAQKMMARAEADFEKAITFDPTLKWAWAHYGELCRNQVCSLNVPPEQRKSYFSRGRTYFEKAIEVGPNEKKYAWAYAHYGALLANVRHEDLYDEAIDLLLKAQDAYGNENAWVYGTQLICYYQKKNMTRAFHAMFMAITLDPNILNDGIVPPIEITRVTDLTYEDLFMWALRSYSVVSNLSTQHSEHTGVLKGFFQPFIAYFSVVHDAFSFLADMVDSRDHFENLREDRLTEPVGASLEVRYRYAGQLALGHRIFGAESQRLKAIEVLIDVLSHLKSDEPRDDALLNLWIRDVTFHGYITDLKPLLPEEIRARLHIDEV